MARNALSGSLPSAAAMPSAPEDRLLTAWLSCSKDLTIINQPIVSGLRSVRLTGLGDLGLSAVGSAAPLAATVAALDPAVIDLGQTLDSVTATDLNAPGRGPRGASTWVRDVVG